MMKVQVHLPSILIIICAICMAYLYDYKNKIRNELDTEFNYLNVTTNANTSFLLFNRNPKAGTSTISNLLQYLQKGTGVIWPHYKKAAG